MGKGGSVVAEVPIAPVGFEDAELVEPEIRRVRMSLAEYESLPEKPKHEWVDGWALIMSPAMGRHSALAAEFAYALKRDLTDVKVLSEPGLSNGRTRRVPDVMVVPQASFMPDSPYQTSVPLIVVEVLSDGTWRNDLIAKADEYGAFGVPQYWIADPGERWVQVRENVGGAWRPLLTLDETNPEADVVVPDHGTVHLDWNDLFGD